MEHSQKCEVLFFFRRVMLSKLLVFDYDVILYKASFACEKRQVVVTHNSSGRSNTYGNISEFWGLKKNEIGGKLAEINSLRKEAGKREFDRSEFSYDLLRSSEPLEYVLHTVKQMILNICEHLNVENYVGYVGTTPGFRVEASTLLEYKGNRKNSPSPIYKEEIIDYLIKHHNAKTSRFYEADEMIVMKCLEDPKNRIAVTNDKDALGCPMLVYNLDHPEWGIMDCNRFGALKMTGEGKKQKLRGLGRIWECAQCLMGDPVDNYKPTVFSDFNFGEVSTYEALKDCKNDKEAWQVVFDLYQKFYPEQKVVVGWRGEPININSDYVLSEIYNMVHMRQGRFDNGNVFDVLDKFGVIRNGQKTKY